MGYIFSRQEWWMGSNHKIKTKKWILWVISNKLDNKNYLRKYNCNTNTNGQISTKKITVLNKFLLILWLFSEIDIR